LAANVAQISKTNDDKLYDLKKTNDDKIADLKDRLVVMEGRSSVSDPTTTAALRDMAATISVLKASNDQGSGRHEQASISMGLVFSIIAAVVAIGVLAVDLLGKR
jgi:hypothetical protein